MYSLFFIIGLVALATWFSYPDNNGIKRLAPIALLLSFLGYGAGVFGADAAMTIKLSTAVRDLLVFGGFGLLFQMLSKNRTVFWLTLLSAVIGGVVYSYFFMKPPVPTPEPLPVPSVSTTTETTNLDTQAELLIELHENTDIKVLQKVIDEYNLGLQRAFAPASANTTDLDDYYTVDVPSGVSLSEVKKALQATTHLDWIEENEVIKIHPIATRKTPKTPQEKYGINDPGIKELWGFEAMKMDELYTLLKKEKVQPQKKVLLAILDTGVDAAHEDIKSNFVSIDAKSNKDKQGHGTHCAGIAAAVTNNGKGIASHVPNSDFVQVTSYKVLNDNGMGTQQKIIKGIIQAADAGADVISMSLGGRSSQTKQRAYVQAIEYANKKGAIVVVAAGNSNRNAKEYAPANVKGVITVSAVDNNIQRAPFSNYVSDIEMGVAAPGVNIYSTLPNNQYGGLSGTSMATPYVAGLVAMMKSIQPQLTTQEVWTILNQTGIKTKDTKKTGKMIFPVEAIKQVI